MTTPHDRTFHNAIGDIVRAWAAQQAEFEARLNEKRVECDRLHDELIEARRLHDELKETVAKRIGQCRCGSWQKELRQ